MSIYSITSNENGMTLSISNSIFGNAIFNNFPLSLTEHTIPALEVYPNPSKSIIYLKSDSNPILDVEMFNLIGNRGEITHIDFDSIDISELSKGLYYLKIATENGTVVERIIKE